MKLSVETPENAGTAEHSTSPGYGGIWLRWVIVNGIATAMGLGGAAVVVMALARNMSVEPGTIGIILMAIGLIAFGTIEGIIAGIMQWQVLRRAIPDLSRGAWMLANALGALMAWTLGVLWLGTIGIQGSPQEPQGFNAVIPYLMAASLGIILGATIGLQQRRVLRNCIPRAGLWIISNALAWGAALPLMLGIIQISSDSVMPSAPAILALAGITGAVMGSISGLCLLRMLRKHYAGESGDKNMSPVFPSAHSS